MIPIEEMKKAAVKAYPGDATSTEEHLQEAFFRGADWAQLRMFNLQRCGDGVIRDLPKNCHETI